MGNSLGGKRKSAKVMQLDGSSFRVKPPAAASDVLRDHPGFQLLESEEVKLLGARARPLAPDAPLRRGRLYFLVALPRRAPGGAGAGHMRRAWSGNLRVGARERLESLMLARRSTSDLSSLTPAAHASASAPTSPLPGGAASPLPAGAAGTPVRLKMRLPRAQVEKLMGESKDPAEAAAKIMELCGAAAAMGGGGGDARASARVTPERPPGILRSPRFAKTPEWGAGFMLPPPAPAKTPQRWPTLPRTKEASNRRGIVRGKMPTEERGDAKVHLLSPRRQTANALASNAWQAAAAAPPRRRPRGRGSSGASEKTEHTTRGEKASACEGEAHTASDLKRDGVDGARCAAAGPG